MRLSTLSAAIVCLAYLCAAEVPKFPKWSAYTKKLMQMAANSTLQAAFQEHIQKYGTANQAVHEEFPCFEPVNSPPATSVHRLSPADVGVVAAIGDSLTAGTGVKALTIIGLLTEWRGLSWSGGGDSNVEEAPTLPNFIKKYNPNVRGFSLKTGSYESKNAHLNVADPGAKAENIPFQAELLVERLRTEPGVNFTHDWKVITIFIGGNDLCDYCENREKYSVANYLKNVQAALDTLHDNVPRAFINLVQVLTVPMVEELNEGLICDALHFFTCRCGAFPKDDAARQEIIDAGVAYRTAVEDLVLSGRYDDRDDFVVVLQPFMEDTHPPKDPDNPSKPDLSFFAPDCFHFSAKGQAAAAEGLWNNMLEPVGQKRKSWTPHEGVLCPDSAMPFFATRDNGVSGRSRSRAAPHSDLPLGADSNKAKGPKTPDQSEGSRVSVTAVILGCALAVITGGVALGVALSIRRRRLRRDPESLGILLHSVNTVVYN